MRRGWGQVSGGGTARSDAARRGRSDAVVRDEGDGQGGMTGGVPSSVRAREAAGWVGFGAGWARPKDFLSF